MDNLETNEVNIPVMSKKLLLLMSCAISATVGNLYYSQPILPLMGAELGVDADKLGVIPAASQLGYAVALLLISPLGDNMPRKKLISILSCFLIIASLFAFVAANVFTLMIACFIIGLSANITQQLIPFAASLAHEDQKGRVIGTLMIGLTLGILLSRTLSGSIGVYYGWRAVFLISAIIAVIFGILLNRYLPYNQPTNRMPYRTLISSTLGLVKKHSLLRQSGISGALWFAAFNALCVTLILYVNEPPYDYDSQQAGLFGVIGFAGIIGAKLAGIYVNKFGSRLMISMALVIISLGFIIVCLFGGNLFTLIVGIALIDFGVFSAQVSNQVRVFSIDPAAQSRINGIYMLFYFIGGALGSLFGVKIFAELGWTGVSIFSLILIGLSLLVNNMPIKSSNVTLLKSNTN
ncbi:MFS transporter [Psychromonas sp. PT13]|uniref:MFS transporter n=1 Tax=Psychromonas sp. PT13 TaxID=3439547 RepID=UPI003EBF4A83